MFLSRSISFGGAESGEYMHCFNRALRRRQGTAATTYLKVLTCPAIACMLGRT